MKKQEVIVLAFLATAYLSPAFGATPKATSLPLTSEAVNNAGLVTPVGAKTKGAAVLRAQVLLDRAHFSRVRLMRPMARICVTQLRDSRQKTDYP